MAQHISIKHYLNEEWLFNLIDKCKTIAWQFKEVENSSNYFKKINDNLELLPIQYACDYNKNINDTPSKVRHLYWQGSKDDCQTYRMLNSFRRIVVI